MKMKINHLFLFALFTLFSFTACQDEAAEVDNPSEQETIVANSALATLMSRTTANFGAADNILDGSSCFSVELPVTIIVSDITIIIESEEDLEQLEDLFDDFNDDDDFLDFIFPITIIFSDYTELVIENEDQLENFIDECDEDDDDIIECVDFVYPISFSVFNSGFNLIDTVVIENDEALYTFLDELEDDENALIVSLNYPVTLEYANGETLEVNTNQELAEAIEAAGDDCDDEAEDCEAEDVAENLVECPWEVYLYSNNDLENLSGPYTFTFNSDGTMVLEGVLQDPYTTTWELIETNNGLELNIASFYYFEEQFGTWLVVECDDDDLKFEHLTVDGTGLFFEQDCEDDLDCSLTDISSILQECPWDFTDGTGNFNNYQMVFNANGDLLIPEGAAASAIGGDWGLSVTDNGVILTFSELTAFQDTLGGGWLIVECDDERLELVKGNQNLVLEQNCGGDLGCSLEYINTNIVECAWELQTNLIDTLEVVYVYFTPNGQVLSSNNDGIETQIGTWEILPVSTNIFIELSLQLGFETLNGQWQVVECEEDELYLMNGNNYISLEQDCDIENPFECFESFDAQIEICDNGADGPNTFDLTIAFANCTPSADVVTYYETQVDAETGANTIASPSAYNTVDIESTIYVRVEIGDQFEVFIIQLIVSDCNQGSCSEDDVDGILRECIWNAVNYNGSDNLINFNFDFEDNSQTVVIYTNEVTIDAMWSTSQSDDGVIITFSNVAGSNIQVITGEWLVVECEADRLELHRGDDILVLERNCD